MAGAAEPQQQGAIGFIKVHDLHLAAMGSALIERGAILRTTDGGVTWTRQASGTTDFLNSVSFTDANTGTAVGRSGVILRTTDGGVTWTRQFSGSVNCCLKSLSARAD